MKPKSPKGKQKSPKRKPLNIGKLFRSPTAAEKARKLFVKGGPGGPGRPKGSGTKVAIKKYLEDALQLASVTIRMPDGKEHILSGKQLLAMEMVDLALNGPLSQGVRQRALGDVIDRIEGKPLQAIKNLGDGMGKVSITIKRELNDEEDPNVEVRTERVEPTEEKK
jgi:hypothetical protein